MSKPPLTLQAPPSPDPVPVALDPATTALLVFDVVDPICERFPICRTHMAPAIAALLARARKAGVTVAYGTRAHHKSHWLPEVAPQPGDIQIENQAQDRFYNTDLDTMLKAKGITTLILVGWKVSGSVTYTSVGATLRGYTVVVPVDASLDATDFEIAVGRHQILQVARRHAAMVRDAVLWTAPHHEVQMCWAAKRSDLILRSARRARLEGWPRVRTS